MNLLCSFNIDLGLCFIFYVLNFANYLLQSYFGNEILTVIVL